MVTESDIDSSIIMQLVRLGWQPDPKQDGRNVFRQSPKTREEKNALGLLRPDYILYADANSNRASVVIEAKKPNVTLAKALAQGRQYAEKLNAPVVVATDGYRLKTWHMQGKSPLILNNIEVDELFNQHLARHFADNPIYESFLKTERTGKKDLIAKFRKANDILREEGLDAGIIRFSEFANLMFLKMRLENGDYIAGCKWDDLQSKRGLALLELIRMMFENMQKDNSELFRPTKIQLPQHMEALVDILSSFRLSGIKDDIKGVAFEHFIHAYTQGVKNDLGQYFTPRHIVRMMVDYLKPQLGEKVYDPFCGTGGMLIECFRYINQHLDPSDMEGQKVLKTKTIYGRDNSSVARIAMMNMIMFGDGHSNVERGDSYQKLADARGQYDIVITNIPFSQTTRYVEGYPVCPAKGAQNGDSVGVQHCLESLKSSDNARAAIIVPIGFLYKNALRQEREYILKNYDLEQVVELTPKCFNPYTEQQTAVLMLRQRRGDNTFVYYRVHQDGFSQDGYRTPLPGANDIDKVAEKQGGELAVGKAEHYRYKNITVVLPAQHARLKDLAEVRKGDSISPKTSPKLTENGTEPILMVADISLAHIDYCLDKSKFCINDLAISTKNPYLYPTHTIVIPSSGKATLLDHRALLGRAAYLTSTLTGIIAKEIEPYYLFYFFLGFRSEVISYDLGYPGLNVEDIKNIPVPLRTPKERQKIVTEIAALAALHKKFKSAHETALVGSNRLGIL